MGAVLAEPRLSHLLEVSFYSLGAISLLCGAHSFISLIYLYSNYIGSVWTEIFGKHHVYTFNPSLICMYVFWQERILCSLSFSAYI